MKKTDLCLTILLFILCSSCGDDLDNKSSLYFKTIIPNGEETLRSSNVDSLGLSVLFKGAELEWYNATTGELKLRKTESWFPIVNLVICLDKEILFDLPGVNMLQSQGLGHPVLIIDPNWEKFYIGRSYPAWEYWKDEFWADTDWDRTDEYWVNWVNTVEKNWKAIEPGWNKFIEQLKKEGKYKE